MQKSIRQFIEEIIKVVLQTTEACFGPLSAPSGQSLEDALFAEGVAIPGGCGKRQLRLGTRGDGETEELVIVLGLSPEAAGNGSLAEARQWAQEAYKAMAAVDEVVARQARVVVSRGIRSPTALYRVSIKGAEDLPG